MKQLLLEPQPEATQSKKGKNIKTVDVPQTNKMVFSESECRTAFEKSIMEDCKHFLFEPAQNQGKPVRSTQILMIPFRLE